MNNGFEGFYFKHQADGMTLALIPGRSRREAFIQVVTNDRAYYLPYAPDAYGIDGVMRVGDSRFSADGIQLSIADRGLTLNGSVRYHGLTPIRGDIMGPFRFFPMECRHTVVSMRHRLEGALVMNGRTLDFTGGTGYIEGDSGRSFPSSYTWAQCNSWADGDSDSSVMVSAARIPFMGLRFWGCIAVVWHKGREYRLATYRGARILERSPRRLAIGQGGMRLTVEVPEHAGHGLRAPDGGDMCRTIHESPDMRARLVFSRNGAVVFDRVSDHASYEYVQ